MALALMGVLASFQSDGWQAVISTAARCRVYMPGEAELKQEESPAGTAMQTWSYTAKSGADSNFTYVLFYLELSDEAIALDKDNPLSEQIRSYRALMPGGEIGEELYDKPIPGSLKGHELLYVVKDLSSFISIRGYRLPNGLLMQMVITPQSRMPNAPMQRYLNSLEIDG